MTDMMRSEPREIVIPEIPDDITVDDAIKQLNLLLMDSADALMASAKYYVAVKDKLGNRFSAIKIAEKTKIPMKVLNRLEMIGRGLTSPMLVVSTADKISRALMQCSRSEQERYGERHELFDVVVPDENGNIADKKGKPFVRKMTMEELDGYGHKIISRVIAGNEKSKIRHVRSVNEQCAYLQSQRKTKWEESTRLVDNLKITKEGNLIVKSLNILRPSQIEACYHAMKEIGVL